MVARATFQKVALPTVANTTFRELKVGCVCPALLTSEPIREISTTQPTFVLFSLSVSQRLLWSTSVPQMPNKLSDFLSFFFSAPTPFETGRVCYFCLKLPFFTTRCCGFSGANCMKPVLPHVRLPPLDLILLYHEQYGTDIGLHPAETPARGGAFGIPDAGLSQISNREK